MKFRGILALASLTVSLSAQQATQSGSGTIGTVLPQVAPGMQQNNNNNGRGISFVTRPTPTAASASLARGFFAAGGVQLGGGGAAAAGAGTGATAGSGAAVFASKPAPKATAPAVPSTIEINRLTVAASRGDARAKARLAEIGRAMAADAGAAGR